jgi:DNA helicase HerA-like ATPase
MEQNLKCPGCNAAIKAGTKFCNECGAKIDAPAPTGATPAAAPASGASSSSAKDKLWVATGSEPVYMITRMLNRHGLIAGATGTGKTVTIKVLAEMFSDMGVPVFMADVKGDVSGLCKAGEKNAKVEERVQSMGIKDFAYCDYPVRFFDVYGKNGIPVRTTIAGMGPILLARILGLNETQTGVLQVIFKMADDQNLLLIDLRDLQALVRYAADNSKALLDTYGNLSTQTLGTIQRNLLTLATNGGEVFFGEPALNLQDWFGCDQKGRGYINLLDCVALFQSPQLYSTFLLWMLSSLYEMLPEVGDLDKPKMVYFFDEAHLLFTDAPKVLLQKIEQVARLIRSKGVGIYFITQAPSDIPDNVLSQLGNKIQHALRAYTPKDQKAIKAAAASFRTNPAFSCEAVLGQLNTGEALVSMLDEKGAPQMVERAFILPPKSFLGAAAPERIRELTNACPLYGKYVQKTSRESAFDVLQKRPPVQAPDKPAKQPKAQPNMATTLAKRAASSTVSAVGRQAGNAIFKGIFGKK